MSGKTVQQLMDEQKWYHIWPFFPAVADKLLNDNVTFEISTEEEFNFIKNHLNLQVLFAAKADKIFNNVSAGRNFEYFYNLAKTFDDKNAVFNGYANIIKKTLTSINVSEDKEEKVLKQEEKRSREGFYMNQAKLQLKQIETIDTTQAKFAAIDALLSVAQDIDIPFTAALAVVHFKDTVIIDMNDNVDIDNESRKKLMDTVDKDINLLFNAKLSKRIGLLYANNEVLKTSIKAIQPKWWKFWQDKSSMLKQSVSFYKSKVKNCQNIFKLNKILDKLDQISTGKMSQRQGIEAIRYNQDFLLKKARVDYCTDIDKQIAALQKKPWYKFYQSNKSYKKSIKEQIKALEVQSIKLKAQIKLCGIEGRFNKCLKELNNKLPKIVLNKLLKNVLQSGKLRRAFTNNIINQIKKNENAKHHMAKCGSIRYTGRIDEGTKNMINELFAEIAEECSKKYNLDPTTLGMIGRVYNQTFDAISYYFWKLIDACMFWIDTKDINLLKPQLKYLLEALSLKNELEGSFEPQPYPAVKDWCDLHRNLNLLTVQGMLV